MRTYLPDLGQQNRLSPGRPSLLIDLYGEDVRLWGLTGYQPLRLIIQRLRSQTDDSVLVVEQAVLSAIPKGFRPVYSAEGEGGKLLIMNAAADRTYSTRQGFHWISTGSEVLLRGDTGIITGFNIAFGPMTSQVQAEIYATVAASPIKPMLRIRRKSLTAATPEVIFIGTGALDYFSVTAANAIMPGSLTLSYGGKTNVIRDDGKGHFYSVYPDIRLNGIDDSVDYVTGDIKISFAPGFIPPVGNVIANYEIPPAVGRDDADYDIEWFLSR